MQTFTFYASDDKLENRGNKLCFTVSEGRSCCSGREWQRPKMNPSLDPNAHKALLGFFYCYFYKDGCVS